MYSPLVSPYFNILSEASLVAAHLTQTTTNLLIVMLIEEPNDLLMGRTTYKQRTFGPMLSFLLETVSK